MSVTKQPNIPEKSWENPFPDETPLADLFEEVVTQNRDIVIIIDDYLARRGTGKTVASLNLASGMDQTDEGITFEKTTLEPEEIRNAYANQPKRSGLVLDEGEVGASNRQAMTKTNQALREIMSMGRVEEKYVVVNTPSKSFIDRDILKLADVWISMIRRGLGLVHFLELEPYSENLLTRQVQWLEIDDIPKESDLRGVYNKLTKEKRKRIQGDEGDGFIPLSEHEELLRRGRKEAKMEKRDEIIRGIWTHPEISQLPLSQRMLGEAVGLDQSRISGIVQSDASSN